MKSMRTTPTTMVVSRVKETNHEHARASASRPNIGRPNTGRPNIGRHGDRRRPGRRRHRLARCSCRCRHHRRPHLCHRCGPPRPRHPRRDRSRGCPRFHRHPHPLRRAGVLRPGAHAVVVPWRHDRRRRQLRLFDRAGSCRRRADHRSHVGERRGHGLPGSHRRCAVGLPNVSPVPGVGRITGLAAQLLRVPRPHRAAPLHHGLGDVYKRQR